MPIPPQISSPTERIDQFFAEKRPPTPCIVLDLDVARARHSALQQLLPKADIYYAVKANPAPEILSALAKLGTKFESIQR